MMRRFSKGLAMPSVAFLAYAFASGCASTPQTPAEWDARYAWCHTHPFACETHQDRVIREIGVVVQAESMAVEDPKAADLLPLLDDTCTLSKFQPACAVAAKLRAASEAKKAEVEAVTAARAKVKCFGEGEIPNGAPIGEFISQRTSKIPDINGDGKPESIFKTVNGETVILATTPWPDCYVDVYRMNGYIVDNLIQVLGTKTNGWSDLTLAFQFNHRERYVNGFASVQAVFDGTKYHWTHLNSCENFKSPAFDPAIDCDWVFVTLNPDRDEIIAARKREADDAKAAVEAAQIRCKADLVKCKETCSHEAVSYECAVIGAMYADGDHVLGLNAPDIGKAIAIYKAGCSSGNKVACLMVTRLDAQIEHERLQLEQKKARDAARAALPGMFAQCHQLRARIILAKAEVERAARSGNRSRVATLQPPFAELSDKWNGLVHEIDNTVANAVSHPQRMQDNPARTMTEPDPEYDRLTLQAHNACFQ